MLLTELMSIHDQVMATTPATAKRYLYANIHWNSRAICIQGDRGVGKTTLMCQYLLDNYSSVDKALYISADNIHVAATGLFAIAREYFTHGGEALFIDEIHKYPDWSIELKNIIDTYRKHQIIFSGSSSLNLTKSKADLSRRVVYHKLPGLSFREYLNFAHNKNLPSTTLEQLLKNHTKIADSYKAIPLLKYFREYLSYGYYPFFLEGTHDYLAKVNNIIEKVIFEDIAVIYNLRQTTLPVLKKLLWLITTSPGLQPNIDRISKNLRVSREVIYNCLDYLDQAGLLNNIYVAAQGMKLVRKPSKLYLDNTNLLAAIHGHLNLHEQIGSIRETFFANQLQVGHAVKLHDHSDFSINDRYVFEIGGRHKTNTQIKDLSQAYLAVDDIEVGYGNKIPLYLFGFLY